MNRAVVHARPEETSTILLRWLVGLRWVLFFLLAITLPIGEHLFGFKVHYEVSLPAILVVIVLNAAMHRRLKASGSGRDAASRTSGPNPPVSVPAVAIGVAVDLVAIGVVLAGAGGAANPFSALFFVHVALAASLLPARMTFALSALATGVFAALFMVPSGSCCANHPADEGFSAHLYGMLLAFVLCAGLVAYFLTRVRGALDGREREIARLRREAEQGARFAALGTLAAGTAHELATPLGTIAVLAGEIRDPSTSPEAAQRHAAAIGAQVTRCRDVITKMQVGAAAEDRAAAEVNAGVAVERAVATWRAAHPDTQVLIHGTSGEGRTIGVRADEVEAALCALLDNALYATLAAKRSDPIVVEVTGAPDAVAIVVEDAGVGIAPELQGRVGEPFLTTKEPGDGMGLGLYLVRRLLEQAGGRLEISPRSPHGTKVVLHLSGAGA
jgi:two-component system sensor histidine kinase RegB